MKTAVVASHCPKCGAPIPVEAPGGLCPKCVLGGAATPSEASGALRRVDPPAVEQVRAAFSQLEILELVGQGGMGFVYAARQPQLDRIVALKLLPVAVGSDPTFAERFTREGRLLARLNHPNIVSVYDFGQAEGFCFLIMEFVDGVNLRQAMRSGRFSSREALAIVPRICEALQYAHEQGVLHRDIKPENILLDARGRVKIADFGIAKLVGDQSTDFTLTASGARLGTPHYMAPEQIETPADVDHRADIYSLGVVFYELLTGELPLGRFAPPSAKAELDARVDEIVLRALAKERELRQQSAGEVKTQVEEVTSGRGEETSGAPAENASLKVHLKEPAQIRWATEHQPLVLLGLVALFVLLIADVIPLLIGVVPSIGRSGQGSFFGAVLLLPLIGGAGWLTWLSWQFRDRLLAPLGFTRDSVGRPLRLTATALLLVLTVRLALQGLLFGSVLIGLASSAVRSSIVLSVLLLLGAAGLGLWMKSYWQRPWVLTRPTPPPVWCRRAGILFLLAGALAFLPTVFSWGSSMRVWHSGTLLGLVGLAVLTRDRLWRAIALGVCWVMVILGIVGLVTLPAILTAGLPQGFSADVAGTEAHPAGAILLGLAQGFAFVAGLALLGRPDVVAAFGLAVPAGPEEIPNPWPHRLGWLVIGLLSLSAAALSAAFLAPALQRSSAPVGGMAAGLLPLGVGFLLVWLYRRTRPTAAKAKPRAQWNPWPQRIFWGVAVLILLPAFLLFVGLLVPRMVANRKASQFLPTPNAPPVLASWGRRPIDLQTESESVFGLEQNGLLAFLLFYPGPLRHNWEGYGDENQHTWMDRGSVTIPGEPALPFQRSYESPDQILLAGTAYDLNAGRLFVVEPGGRIRQTAVHPPPGFVTQDNLALISVMAGVTPATEVPTTSIPDASEVLLKRIGLTVNLEQTSAQWSVQSGLPGIIRVRFLDQFLELELKPASDTGSFSGRIDLSFDRAQDGAGVVLTARGQTGNDEKRFEAFLAGAPETILKAAAERMRNDLLLPAGPGLALAFGKEDPVELEFRRRESQP